MKFLSLALLTIVCLSVFTSFAMAASQTLTVSARDTDSLRFYLNDGDKMKYTAYVNGGNNDDVLLDVKNPYGGSIGQKGKITESYSSTIYADTDGYYVFEFDNSISLLSRKQITLNYDIIKKPIVSNIIPSNSNSGSSSSSFGVLLMFGGVVVVIIIVAAVWKIVSGSKNSYQEGKHESYIEEVEKKLSEESKANEGSFEDQKDSEFLGILKQRLAKGEITKEEYHELKKEFE